MPPSVTVSPDIGGEGAVATADGWAMAVLTAVGPDEECVALDGHDGMEGTWCDSVAAVATCVPTCDR